MLRISPCEDVSGPSLVGMLDEERDETTGFRNDDIWSRQEVRVVRIRYDRGGIDREPAESPASRLVPRAQLRAQRNAWTHDHWFLIDNDKPLRHIDGTART